MNIQRCGCGAPLQYRQRYCVCCARDRRRETKRESQKKYIRFKGTGTINYAGEYKFMLWAGDGGKTDPDTFRIKIWEEDDLGNEDVVYDKGMDQAIGGGSIVIHAK